MTKHANTAAWIEKNLDVELTDWQKQTLEEQDELPVYLQPAPRRIPTGRNAQRSLADRFARFAHNQDPGEDEYFPVQARAQRRAEKARDARERKKGQRNFIRREWKKERGF